MSILVTGATGFVGGAIAANLAEKGLLGETRFAVRGESTAEGLARLRANLARFELGAAVLDGLSERQIVPFDLRDAAAAELGDPEILINCAALATFSNHPALWDTNVGGVLELGRLASRASGSSGSCTSARPCHAASWPTAMCGKPGTSRRWSSMPCPTPIPRGWPS